MHPPLARFCVCERERGKKIERKREEREGGDREREKEGERGREREREREKGRGAPRSLSLPTLHIPRASARPYGKMQLKELSAGKKNAQAGTREQSGESSRS